MRLTGNTVTWTTIVATFLLVILAASTPVQAHATPVETQPPSGASLDEPPTEIWVRFSEIVDPSTTVMEVYDTRMDRVDDDDLRISEDQYTATISISSPLPEGGYLVQWSTISAADGHYTAGSWGFAVGDATPPTGEVTEIPEATPLSVIARVFMYAGFSLFFGGLAFVLYVHPLPLQRIGKEEHLAAWGLGSVLLGVLILTIDGTRISGLDPLSYLAGTEVGQNLLLRALFAGLGIALAAALILQPRYLKTSPQGLPDPQRRRGAHGALVVIGLGAAWATASLSHASARGVTGLLYDLSHLVGGSVWVGSLVFFVIYLAGQRKGPDWEQIIAVGMRYSLIAVVALVAVLGAGVINALLIAGSERVFDPTLYTGSLWGRLLATKVGLVVLMLALALVNRSVHLARKANALNRDKKIQAGPSGFMRTVGAEASLGIAVVILTAVLTAVSPPYLLPDADEETGPEFFLEEQDGEAYRFILRIDPAPKLHETARFEVELIDLETQTPEDEAFRIRMTLRNLDQDFGDDQVTLTNEGNGTYATQGAHFHIPGEYEITLMTQTPRVFRDEVTFTTYLEDVEW